MLMCELVCNMLGTAVQQGGLGPASHYGRPSLLTARDAVPASLSERLAAFVPDLSHSEHAFLLPASQGGFPLAPQLGLLVGMPQEEWEGQEDGKVDERVERGFRRLRRWLG